MNLANVGHDLRYRVVDMNAIVSGVMGIDSMQQQYLRRTPLSPPKVSFADSETWNKALIRFEDVSFDQTSTYAAGQWGEERTSRIVVADEGTILGGACAISFLLPGTSAGMVYLKHGPIWRLRNQEGAPERYRTVLSAIVAEYGMRRGQCIVVVPRPNPISMSVETGVLNELGFVVRRPNIDPNRFLVDIALDETAQLKSLSQKWRYNLRKASKNGIYVAEGVDAEAVRNFTGLHGEMVGRKRYTDRAGVELIPRMLAELPRQLRPVIFIARREGRAIAGAVVGVHGDTAYYLFGATSAESLPLKGGYALQWAIIQWLRGTRVRWYDLGGEAGEPGLAQFKKGLVGTGGAVLSVPGEYEYFPSRKAYLAAEIIMGIRNLRRRLLP